ncbi:YbbR-like domain-containing protein [Thermodesulfobacteriota bacterium]
MKNVIFDNFGLKLFSFIFALTLWFFVSGKGRSYTEISYTLPLEFKNIPGNLVITNDFNDKIEIRMSGPTAILNSVRSEKLKYTIDLSKIVAGESSFSINPENIGLSSGLKITKMSPSKIDLNIENIITKTVPISINIVGEVAKGYTILSQQITPSSVDIKGAESEVKKIESIPTIEINISGATSKIEKEVDLVIKDIFYSEIVGEKYISAVIEVVEEIIEKKFRDVDIVVRGAAANETYKIIPNKMNMTISGTFLTLNDLTKDGIFIYINAEDITNKPKKLRPIVELTNNMRLIEASPNMLEVSKKSVKKRGQKK